jgi:uncharacterized protein Smg (DUF494 family)
MQEKIVEILIYVLSELKKTNKPISEVDIASLEKKGYTQSEISTAFSWLVDRLNFTSGTTQISAAYRSGSFRILDGAEKHAISPEAFGYLIQLRELNVISEIELELIIERSILSGFERLNPSEMQSVVASVLFDLGNRASASSKLLLYSSDKIH